jgi:hypothetical protein
METKILVTGIIVGCMRHPFSEFMILGEIILQGLSLFWKNMILQSGPLSVEWNKVL